MTANNLKNIIEEQTLFEVQVFTEWHLRLTDFNDKKIEVWKSKSGRFTIMIPYRKASKQYAYTIDELINKVEKI
jgi:hypothetical protein